MTMYMQDEHEVIYTKESIQLALLETSTNNDPSINSCPTKRTNPTITEYQETQHLRGGELQATFIGLYGGSLAMRRRFHSSALPELCLTLVTTHHMEQHLLRILYVESGVRSLASASASKLLVIQSGANVLAKISK
ncbi:hypothetical protein PHLCEN_2v2254 [Hermanssonia centrifuga]|uniref:Uncharacterized protein n=1 Tax=Hermanssonia centrifuga TaxID=98765 RepID=A0A2R6RPR0_9APHY|nr:hypothetical protein PHLCEN_2v2254 [Hermanssonia centrifuga]